MTQVSYGTAVRKRKTGRILDAELAHNRAEAERIVRRQNEKESEWGLRTEWIVVEIRPVTESPDQDQQDRSQ